MQGPRVMYTKVWSSPAWAFPIRTGCVSNLCNVVRRYIIWIGLLLLTMLWPLMALYTYSGSRDELILRFSGRQWAFPNPTTNLPRNLHHVWTSVFEMILDHGHRHPSSFGISVSRRPSCCLLLHDDRLDLEPSFKKVVMNTLVTPQPSWMRAHDANTQHRYRSRKMNSRAPIELTLQSPSAWLGSRYS
jgi:hypothetical protein